MKTIERDGFTFSVKHEHDSEAGTPWDREEGHGPVSEWTRRDKRPGELILHSDRGSHRYYDFEEAVRIAMRDGWGSRHAIDGMTKRQIASLAAQEDYENLRAWCNDEWEYIGVIVTLLDADGDETKASDSLWGVDDNGSYADTVADDCAANIISTYHLNFEDCDSLTIGATTWRLR